MRKSLLLPLVLLIAACGGQTSDEETLQDAANQSTPEAADVLNGAAENGMAPSDALNAAAEAQAGNSDTGNANAAADQY